MKTTAKTALVMALTGAGLNSHAVDFKLGDEVQGKLTGVATLGTTLRTEEANPANYALIPSSKVPGVAPGQMVGQTGGSDLNFGQGKPVSTVLKGVFDLDLSRQKAGVFVRAAAWTDLTLGHQSAPYGNYANGFQTNAALSDSGFAPTAKFNNAVFRDAYVYNRFDLGNGQTVDARLGRQVLRWGQTQLLNNGLNAAINPTDFASQARPGALPDEGKLPLGMLSARWNSGGAWTVDGFLPYEFRSSVAPGCGTFFDVSSIIPQGCNMAAAVPSPIPGTPLSTINSLTEQSLLSSGYYIHRNGENNPSGAGQFGLSAGYKSEALKTEFRGYVLRMHSNLPGFRLTVENVNGATLPAGVGGGLGRLQNANGLKYATAYAEDVNLYGLGFNTKLDATTGVYGELAYRPNQALNMNPTDLVIGFLLRSPTSLLQNAKGILGVPAGGEFNAYDRYGVTTGSLGVNKVFPKALGAERVALVAEVGFSHVNGLPDPTVMRYGRPLAYGAAPYNNGGTLTACSEASPGLSGAPGKTCTTDGFISQNAWGLRTAISASYPDALWGARLTPSLYLAKDMRGYSYDGSFSQGRFVLRPALRADWAQGYFAELAFTRLGGGAYNLASDRSHVMLVAGARF